jgi:outer membrane protein assembly factor BamA
MALLGTLPSAARAQYVLEDIHNPNRYDPDTLAVPIAYYSDGFKGALGVAAYTDGLFQRQMDSYIFAIGSSNGSYGAIGGMHNLQFRPIDRLFLDWELSYIRTNEDENNIDGNRAYLRENAGSNRSDEDDLVASPSNDFTGNFTFKYLLPIGNGRDTIIDTYRLNEGLLESGASGGDGYNPFRSGRTFLELGPSFEYMDIRSAEAVQHQWDTFGVVASAVYDNSDYDITPQRGNVTTLSLQRDFGAFGSPNPWTNISADFAQYISLGRSGLFRQQVLALDCWTSYTTSWSQSGAPGRVKLSDAPPFYAGSTLGGMQRMRGYPEERFHDRAAIYGCAELRLIPSWNPLGKIALLKNADIAWLQVVTFVEVGRVADEYTYGKLFHNMKGDGGVGIRVLTGDTLLRIDVAGSNEGIQVWANLAQAF